MGARLALAPLLLLLLLTGACTTTSAKTAETAPIQWKSTNKTVLLIEPDIELGELTAGGMVEPRADWTQSARQNIDAETTALLGAKGIQLTKVERLSAARDVQLAKLHGVVGQAILTHLYIEGLRLPNKGKALDWTLGPGTNEMRLRHGADYGLFVFVRDSYTSAGRALMMVGAAVLGVGIQGGTQVAFASLVDLSTGNIVWFNRLISSTGDLRTPEPARKVVDKLLGEVPL